MKSKQDEPPPTTDYALAIRTLLEEEGITVYALAKQAKVTQQAVHDLISGQRAHPHISTIAKLLEAVGLPWAFLDRFRDKKLDGIPVTSWDWQALNRIRSSGPAGHDGENVLYDCAARVANAPMLARLAKAGLIEPVGKPADPEHQYDHTPVELRTRWRLTKLGTEAVNEGWYEGGKE